jgi:hypothetical protein
MLHRVQLRGEKAFGRTLLEMADNLGEWVRVGAHDGMDVIWKNGAGEHSIVRFGDGIADAPRYFPGLFPRELHRRERERLLRGVTPGHIMRDCGDRMTRCRFGWWTVLSKRD